MLICRSLIFHLLSASQILVFGININDHLDSAALLEENMDHVSFSFYTVAFSMQGHTLFLVQTQFDSLKSNFYVDFK